MIVSLSATTNYLPGLVLSAASWRILGYPVAAALVTEDAGAAAVVAAQDALAAMGVLCETRFEPESAQSGKMARYTSPVMTAYPEATVLISDADMMRLRPMEWPPALTGSFWTGADTVEVRHEPAFGEVVAWGGNLYDGTQWEPRWPACYLAALGATWTDLGLTRPEILAHAPEPNGNWSDELAFKAAVADREARVIDVPRDRECAMAARHRIERHQWRGGADVVLPKAPVCEDAHLPHRMTATDFAAASALLRWLADTYGGTYPAHAILPYSALAAELGLIDEDAP